MNRNRNTRPVSGLVAAQVALQGVPEIALQRMTATWAANGWPSQLPHVSLYPTTTHDGTGQTLTGANKYTLTFPKGQMPPVNPMAFGSITMYTIDGGLWFYPNPLNKLTVSPRDKLMYNADGSLTLHFQHESPGADKEANWLPAPAGPFVVQLAA